jgi:uncharacterized protein (TIGR03083 family)
MEPEAGSVRDALVRQWEAIAAAVGALDPACPSRIPGWRNREVIAHLAAQPSLLVRFLKTASRTAPEVSLAANLAGTVNLAELIHTSAREASDGDLDFEGRYRRALPALLDADLSGTVTTIQGPIALVDYLRTRCVEAVVHGGDLIPSVVPDPAALHVAASALREALRARRPDLMTAAMALPDERWVDQATGRAEATGEFAGVLPVMA